MHSRNLLSQTKQAWLDRLRASLSASIDSRDDCPICLSTLRAETACILACQHGFCAGCIVGGHRHRVLRSQVSCPVCRRQIDSIYPYSAIFNETLERPTPVQLYGARDLGDED